MSDSHEDLPTRELLELTRAGDEVAASILFAKERRELLKRASSLYRRTSWLRRVTSPEDLVAEVFKRVFSDRFVEERFEWRGKGSLTAALYVILKRVIVDCERRMNTSKRKSPPPANRDVLDCVESEIDPTPSSHARAAELVELCRDHLTDQQWFVFCQRAIFGGDFETVALRMGSTAAAVRGIYHRACEQLRIALPAMNPAA